MPVPTFDFDAQSLDRLQINDGNRVWEMDGEFPVPGADVLRANHGTPFSGTANDPTTSVRRPVLHPDGYFVMQTGTAAGEWCALHAVTPTGPLPASWGPEVVHLFCVGDRAGAIGSVPRFVQIAHTQAFADSFLVIRRWEGTKWRVHARRTEADEDFVFATSPDGHPDSFDICEVVLNYAIGEVSIGVNGSEPGDHTSFSSGAGNASWGSNLLWRIGNSVGSLGTSETRWRAGWGQLIGFNWLLSAGERAAVLAHLESRWAHVL